MKKLFVSLSFLIAALCLTAQAKADLSTWDYKVTAKIVDHTMVGNFVENEEQKTGSEYRKIYEDKSDDDTRLEWGGYKTRNIVDGEGVYGNPPAISYFELQAVDNGGNYEKGEGTYIVGSGLEEVLKFIHSNTEIPLVNGKLYYPVFIEIALTFTFTNSEIPDSPSKEVDIHLGFIETPNANVETQNDVFFFLNPNQLDWLLSPIDLGNNLELSFYSGFEALNPDSSSESRYYNLALEALQGEGLYAGGDPEIFGWITKEFTETPNEIAISFKIQSSVDTPEPASMLFLASSLAGFGLIQRYRKRKQNA